jgi:thiamine biosynthesis lipoprotein
MVKTGALAMLFMASCLRVSAQVFMSEADAIKIIAPQAVWTEDIKSLDDAARQSLAKSTRLRFAEPGYRFQVAREGDRATAYALTLEEIGKTEPITFTVGLDAAGKITEVILLVYRESRGAEVRDPRFLKQFRGKTRRDPVQIDRDILNYAGATLSSQALARGVRKALALFEQFYGANSKPTAETIPSGYPSLHSLISDGRIEDSARPALSVMGGNSSRYIQARYLMGTVCEIEVYSSDRAAAERAVNAAFEAMQEVDRRMSNYRADSELSLLNQRAAESDVRVSGELFEVLSLAQKVSEASDGAFDVTVAPLLRAWGFLPKTVAASSIPVRPVVGYRLMQLSAGDQTVRFAQAGLEIDLGGIAKGFAVDRAVKTLRAAGITSARVSAGGSTIYGLGAPPQDPRGWALTLPAGDIVYLRDTAASTSGHSEKFVEVGGHRYSHIFDPRRGEPVSTRIATVTVQAASAMESDALTKPFFILNDREQAGLRQAFPHTRVWIMRSRNQTYAAAR